MNKKPWAGRFKIETDKLMEDFTQSVSFDKRLYKYDIMGSVAHAKMLARSGIITDAEAKEIVDGLNGILEEIKNGEFIFSVSLEDIHMNIEKRLIEKIGAAGEKLHTGRSRNDQVTLDLRLYLRDETGEILKGIRAVQGVLLELAEKYLDTFMPAYTHMQRAQPVLLSHHLLSYIEMFKRDCARYGCCYKRINIMPLGAGAVAGSTLPLDREYVAKLLDFPEITGNSIDTVSDRDYCIEFTAASSILMMHLSRLAEELVLWSTEEFDFLELSDAFATGSSMMPQKKNPDVPELIRGRAGKVYGGLVSLLTMMKGLPLSYSRDMQEDKEPVFTAVDTVKQCLYILPPLLKSTVFNRDKMMEATRKGFLEATDVAEYLVQKGLPFRSAHETVGRVVAYCLEQGKIFPELSLEEWRGFSSLIGDDISDVVKTKNIIDKRKTAGGTARDEVKKRIAVLKKEFKVK